MSGGIATDQVKAVEVLNPNGLGPAMILCEHASNCIPARYKGLGLAADDRDSHAAWDPGARSVAMLLSATLDAPMVASCVSRLVYDCNRPPDAPAAMPETSELIRVPGNRDLSAAARAERIETVYQPFCSAVSEVVSARKSASQATALITVHSFTPVYYGAPRAVEMGILHDDDSRLADEMLARHDLLPHRRIERNAPYGPSDGVTHSLKLHGQSNDLMNVMLEVRNDLLRTPDDERKMAEELLTLIRPSLQALGLAPKGAARA